MRPWYTLGVAETHDAGIDKAKILAEIGVGPAPSPIASPPGSRAGSPGSGPRLPRATEAKSDPRTPAVPGAAGPKRGPRPRGNPLLRHRAEASALLLGFVGLLWLAVGLATQRGTLILLGGAFLALGALVVLSVSRSSWAKSLDTPGTSHYIDPPP